MRLRLVMFFAAALVAACSNSQPLPCGGCQPPEAEVHNPVLPDGGVDDAGNVTPSGCKAVCPQSLSCGQSSDDAGMVVTCGLTCGC